MKDEEYNQTVSKAWEEGGLGGTGMQQVQQKLGNCQVKLSSWSSRKFGSFEKNIKKKTKLLEILQRNEGPEVWEDIKKLQTEIEVLLEHEDCKWKQRAKQNWYQHGDRIYAFFSCLG
jgi:hypothetical protein